MKASAGSTAKIRGQPVSPYRGQVVVVALHRADGDVAVVQLRLQLVRLGLLVDGIAGWWCGSSDGVALVC